jgi:three-Cys-motif partner protein
MVEFDLVGLWSELKVEIIRAYASEYSKIMASQKLKHIYIDAFAGPGVNISRTSGEFVPGSPLNALLIAPPFEEFHFIDADGHRTSKLRQMSQGRQNVFTYEGDCNDILPSQIFPRAAYNDFARALCLLDPYNINLAWNVVAQAGRMRTVEIFLNFMIMDINMNVLKHDPGNVDQSQLDRMNRFWGDDTWRNAAYDDSGNLFGWNEKVAGNEALVEAYRDRLKTVGGFKYVPAPVPMRNSKGAIIYYLFFASPNSTGNRIIEHIFSKYRNKGAA